MFQKLKLERLIYNINKWIKNLSWKARKQKKIHIISEVGQQMEDSNLVFCLGWGEFFNYNISCLITLSGDFHSTRWLSLVLLSSFLLIYCYICTFVCVIKPRSMVGCNKFKIPSTIKFTKDYITQPFDRFYLIFGWDMLAE